MTTLEIILRVQEKLGVEVDGIAGPKTWAAIYREIVKDHIHPEDERVDERSEGNIATLHPEVRPYARSLVRLADQQGIEIKVISGSRSFAEQDALYEQGRSLPGRVVTNARGGYSNHNFGIAFDIGVFESGRYLGETPLYKVVGSIGKSIGLEWGGSWTSFTDEPHFQLRPYWARGYPEKDMLAVLRTRQNNGTDAFA